MNKKRISVVTACYNEEDNVEELYKQVKEQFEKNLPEYEYEHIFIDNASEDNTVLILKEIANKDKNVKIIVNTRNFGHIRSPFHGLLQAEGDAIISIVADLQDPPSLIPEFVKKWEEGHSIVIGTKEQSDENKIMFAIRKLYYKMMKVSSSVDHISNFTGFGLYDKSFFDILRKLDDPYPYFRGLVAEFGSNIYMIDYVQPAREKGKTKNNFFTLYDMAMLGFVNHTKLPLRITAYLGLIFSIVSFLIGLVYLIYKLVEWESFNLGMAPLIIGVFFFSSVQLFFIGVIGEYIGAIYTHVHKRPLVVEKERVNFEKK